MQIIFFTEQIQDSRSIILQNGALYFNQNKYDSPCRYFTENYADFAKCEKLYLPLRPTLEEVCTAYIADSVSKSQKLPRAASMLCDFLSSLSQKEIPFERSSLDTLPVIFQYLCAGINGEKDASKMLDIIFSILRQFMMDMLLFDNLDLTLTPISAKVPAAQTVKTQAEQDLDLYIKDCQNGSEQVCLLPMQNGSLESRRVLTLNAPTCPYPELFASLCGFSMLIANNQNTVIYPTDCSFDAVASLINANDALLERGRNYIKTSLTDTRISELLQDLSCKACKLVYTANVTAKKKLIKKLQPEYLYNGILLKARFEKQKDKQTIVLEHYPETRGKHFHYAFASADSTRKAMLEIDLSTLLGGELTVKNKHCDLFIDIPVDCMKDFHAVSIKCEGGDFALLDDGVISLWDKEPPLDQMRTVLEALSQLELEVLKNPLKAVKILEKATLIKISISSGKGFIKAALIGCNADKRAETLCKNAQDSATILSLRRSRAVIIGVSAFISLLICAFPFAAGFIIPELNYLPITAACALILFGILLTSFIFIGAKRAKSNAKHNNDEKNQ